MTSLGKILKFSAFSLLSSLAAVSLLAAVSYFSDISDAAVKCLISAISALCVAVFSFLLARRAESRGILCGLALALCYLSALCLISVAVFGRISVAGENIFRAFLIILSGMLGGILGINRK